MSFHVPEHSRLKTGPAASEPADGNNGCFIVRLRSKEKVFVVASDGGGWEHVSASLKHRTPTWAEMCELKDIFWDEEDCVIQYHPAKSEYVNCHPFCLHLWRPVDVDIPRPPKILIGI